MRLSGVRGRERAASAPQHVDLPPCEHAGPTDGQGAGVAVQTPGQVRRCVHAQYFCLKLDRGRADVCPAAASCDEGVSQEVLGGGGSVLAQLSLQDLLFVARGCLVLFRQLTIMSTASWLRLNFLCV